EIAWGTIGNASTSEGLFFETINAAGVLQVPMVISVWDDEYGISVHARHQTTKESISEILKGFQRDDKHNGFEIFKVNGWDYAALVDTYEKASQIARHEQVPVMIHVVELTQPQGHSTSGSHERYKDENRLAWEAEYDCLAKMREWMLSNNITTEETLETLEKDIKKQVNEGKRTAWNAFIQPIQQEQQQAIQLLNALANSSDNHAFINKITQELASLKEPIRKDIATTCRKALRYVVSEHSNEKMALQQWLDAYFKTIQPKYSSHLYSESSKAALNIKAVTPTYDSNAEEVDGRVVIRDNFD